MANIVRNWWWILSTITLASASQKDPIVKGSLRTILEAELDNVGYRNAEVVDKIVDVVYALAGWIVGGQLKPLDDMDEESELFLEKLHDTLEDHIESLHSFASSPPYYFTWTDSLISKVTLWMRKVLHVIPVGNIVKLYDLALRHPYATKHFMHLSHKYWLRKADKLVAQTNTLDLHMAWDLLKNPSTLIHAYIKWAGDDDDLSTNLEKLLKEFLKSYEIPPEMRSLLEEIVLRMETTMDEGETKDAASASLVLGVSTVLKRLSYLVHDFVQKKTYFGVAHSLMDKVMFWAERVLLKVPLEKVRLVVEEVLTNPDLKRALLLLQQRMHERKVETLLRDPTAPTKLAMLVDKVSNFNYEDESNYKVLERMLDKWEL